MWQQLVDLCLNIQLNEEEDKCPWKLTKSGQFTVGSLYRLLLKDKQAAIICVHFWENKDSSESFFMVNVQE